MRRALDQYYTPARATMELLSHVSVRDRVVLECCNGAGDISKLLDPEAGMVWTNDIDESLAADFHIDITDPLRNLILAGGIDWVISNPPFSAAPQIVPRMYDWAKVGIAMLLRLSYLEPCFTRKSNRAAWLSEHPPNKLIVLPRISFTGNGKTDNVTCAWMVWEKQPRESYIKVIPR